MTAAQRRVQSLVTRLGEDFTVGGAGHRGVFSNTTSGADRAFLTQSEVDAAGLPLWVCLVAFDDATAVANTVSWNGLTLTVKKIGEARAYGALAGKMLLLG